MHNRPTPLSRRSLCTLCLALGSGVALSPAGWAGPASAPGAQPMTLRYWDWGATPRRDDYQFALLTLALDKTRRDYGPYSLARVVRSYSTSRLRREINRGDVVNVHAGPWRPLEASQELLPERSLRVSVSIMKDLLGYRMLMIRRDDLARFQSMRHPDDLKAMVVGQAKGWVDVAVYRHNGYRVNDSAQPSTLFDMLAKKRFDFLPISVMDADTVLDARPDLADQLTVLPDVLLHFPLPIIFYVNIHEPEIAQRLQAGLALARQDGSFERLFKTSFARELQLIREVSARRFRLANPFVPEALTAERSLETAEPAASATRRH